MAGLVLSGVMAQAVGAQWNVARFDRGRNRAYATMGIDRAMTPSFGYGRVVPVFGHRFQLAADVRVGTTGFDLHDFGARMQVQTALLRWRSLALTGSLTLVARGVESTVSRGFDFGSDVSATAGVYRRGWFLAAEYGYEKADVSYVTYTSWYRGHVDAQARDGWYLNEGGTYHYGAAAGVGVGPVEVFARAGWQRAVKLDTTVPPMYLSLGAGVGF
jgi:hypothetical protein